MIKRILSLFLVLCLLFNLYGCSSSEIDKDQAALNYINSGIKNGDGFLSQLDNRSKIYNQKIDEVVNTSYWTQTDKDKYLKIWKDNYDKYKKWFNNKDDTKITKNDKFLTNVTWILSPTTLANLYNYYQILKIINSNRDKFDDKNRYPYIKSIVPDEWKPGLSGTSFCTDSNIPGSPLFLNFLDKDYITSVAAMDKIPKILEDIKPDGKVISEEITGDIGQNPWFSKTALSSNASDIQGQNFLNEGCSGLISNTGFSKDNKIVSFSGSGNPSIGLGKELYNAKENLGFAYKDEELQKQFNALTSNLAKSGFCGIVFIEEDIKTWFDVPNDPESKHTRISRTLHWELAPF